MAKEIIQMYDKYHSTKKVYPKVLEECLPEDYQGLPDTVEKIPVVVANPTLAGTEGDLEGIQVGDTKYKIGGGKQLYQHNITYSILDTSERFHWQLNITIINDSNTPINTLALLNTYLYNNNLRSASKSLQCSGVQLDTNYNTRYYNIVAVYCDNTSNVTLKAVAYNGDNKKIVDSGFGTSGIFVDTIIPL